MRISAMADAGAEAIAAEPLRASARLKRFRSVSLGLLTESAFVNMIDRSILAIANPVNRNDLGLSPRDIGLLPSGFLWTYAFCRSARWSTTSGHAFCSPAARSCRPRARVFAGSPQDEIAAAAGALPEGGMPGGRSITPFPQAMSMAS